MPFARLIRSLWWLLLLCLPLHAQRIVSLAPNLTEITCSLGLCDRLVGVTDFCLYPPEVQDLAKVGGYIDPNLEIIVAMKPDLVLALPEHQNTTLKLEKLGLRVETIRNWSIADIHESIRVVGQVTGREKEAATVLADLEIRRREATRKKAGNPKCLLVLGHEVTGGKIKEVYIVGTKGFLNEMLILAGGTNVYEAQEPHFPKLNQETLLQLDPDVIIELIPVEKPLPKDLAGKRKAWASVPHLKAIRQGRYYIIHGDHILQAGPRYVVTLTALVEILDRL